MFNGDDKQDFLTPFFQLPTILLPPVPSTLAKFTTVVASEGLDFVHGLFVNDRRGLFADTSRTLLQAR